MTEPEYAPARVIHATMGVPPARLRLWALRYGLNRKRKGRIWLYDGNDVRRRLAMTREERERRKPSHPRPLV